MTHYIIHYISFNKYFILCRNSNSFCDFPALTFLINIAKERTSLLPLTQYWPSSCSKSLCAKCITHHKLEARRLMKRERMVVVQITVFETLKDVSFQSTWFLSSIQFINGLKSSSFIMEFLRENSNYTTFQNETFTLVFNQCESNCNFRWRISALLRPLKNWEMAAPSMMSPLSPPPQKSHWLRNFSIF